MAASRCGSPASAAISAASRSGVKSRCSMRMAPPASVQHAGIGELVLVERMRQRHQDRGPADGRKLGHGRGAGARDDQMRRRHPRRQIGKERRAPRPRRRAAHRSRAPRRGPPRAPAARSTSARASAASSRSIAAGTISAITRAPWLPPNTSSCERSAGVRRGIGRCRRRDHRGPHRIAGARAFAAARSRIEHASVGKPVAIARHARRQQPVGAAHDGVLLVDHGRDAAQRRRQQRRHGRIAAEADHHGGLDAAEQRPGLGGAEREHAAGARKRERIAAAQGRARDDVNGARGKFEMRGARVGGEIDRDAALCKRRGQRLGRKQMPAGAAGRKQHERCVIAPAGMPDRGTASTREPCLPLAPAEAHRKRLAPPNDGQAGWARAEVTWRASRARPLARQRQQHAHARRRARSSTSRHRR